MPAPEYNQVGIPSFNTNFSGINWTGIAPAWNEAIKGLQLGIQSSAGADLYKALSGASNYDEMVAARRSEEFQNALKNASPEDRKNAFNFLENMSRIDETRAQTGVLNESARKAKGENDDIEFMRTHPELIVDWQKAHKSGKLPQWYRWLDKQGINVPGTLLAKGGALDADVNAERQKIAAAYASTMAGRLSGTQAAKIKYETDLMKGLADPETQKKLFELQMGVQQLLPEDQLKALREQAFPYYGMAMALQAPHAGPSALSGFTDAINKHQAQAPAQQVYNRLQASVNGQEDFENTFNLPATAENVAAVLNNDTYASLNSENAKKVEEFKKRYPYAAQRQALGYAMSKLEGDANPEKTWSNGRNLDWQDVQNYLDASVKTQEEQELAKKRQELTIRDSVSPNYLDVLSPEQRKIITDTQSYMDSLNKGTGPNGALEEQHKISGTNTKERRKGLNKNPNIDIEPDMQSNLDSLADSLIKYASKEAKEYKIKKEDGSTDYWQLDKAFRTLDDQTQKKILLDMANQKKPSHDMFSSDVFNQADLAQTPSISTTNNNTITVPNNAVTALQTASTQSLSAPINTNSGLFSYDPHTGLFTKPVSQTAITESAPATTPASNAVSQSAEQSKETVPSNVLQAFPNFKEQTKTDKVQSAALYLSQTMANPNSSYNEIRSARDFYLNQIKNLQRDYESTATGIRTKEIVKARTIEDDKAYSYYFPNESSYNVEFDGKTIKLNKTYIDETANFLMANTSISYPEALLAIKKSMEKPSLKVLNQIGFHGEDYKLAGDIVRKDALTKAQYIDSETADYNISEITNLDNLTKYVHTQTDPYLLAKTTASITKTPSDESRKLNAYRVSKVLSNFVQRTAPRAWK